MRDKIVRGGAAVMVRQLFSIPINAIGVVVTSKSLSPLDYGLQAYLISATAAAMILIDLGTSQALVQVATPPVTKTLIQIQRIKFVGAVVSSILLWAMAEILVRNNNLPMILIPYLPMAGIIGWLQSQRAYASVKLQRRIEWQILAMVDLVEIVTFNLCLVLFAYYLQSAWCFVVAWIVRYSTGCILLEWQNHKVMLTLDQAEKLPVNSIGALLHFGVPLQLTSFFGVLNSLIGPVIIGGTLGVQAVGLTNWSNSIVVLPRMPVQMLPTFLFSVLSERRRKFHDDNFIVAAVSMFGMLIISGISLMLGLLLPWLIVNILGTQWIDAIPIVLVLLLGNVVIFPALVVAAQLTSSGNNTIWLQVNIFSTSLLWVFSWVGVSYWGLSGYAIGVILGTMLTWLVQSTVANWKIHVPNMWVDTLYIMSALGLVLLLNQHLLGLPVENRRLPLYVILCVAAFSLTLTPYVLFRRNQLSLVYSALSHTFPGLASISAKIGLSIRRLFRISFC